MNENGIQRSVNIRFKTQPYIYLTVGNRREFFAGIGMKLQNGSPTVGTPASFTIQYIIYELCRKIPP